MHNRPKMRKFEGILICTDLDGTLLRNDKSISKENLDAIEYFKSEGGFFTIITGRMPYFASDIYSVVRPNAPFGCINGGGLFDAANDKYVWTKTLPSEVLELVEYADNNIEELGIQLNTFDKIYFTRNNEAMEMFRQQTGTPNIPGSYKGFDIPIAKVVFGDVSDEKLNRLADLLNAHPKADRFDFIRSADILYEILPKNTNKGGILPILAEYLGIEMRKIVAIGDYNNDVEMIRTAGVGVAVANAAPEAKAVADVVTVSNEEHAIAKVIYDIESGSIRV